MSGQGGKGEGEVGAVLVEIEEVSEKGALWSVPRVGAAALSGSSSNIPILEIDLNI